MLVGLPNAAAIGALAAILNYIPIIGPALILVVLTLVGILTAPTPGVGLIARRNALQHSNTQLRHAANDAAPPIS
jgi:predicted PurR-regulated permease PerM